MAALISSTREVFTEAVKAVLETWPVLQIAVDNGFGGAHSQQKAEWMVEALQQYFYDNDDLEQEEVEDVLADLMNNEFDTVVDDGSLPQVAQRVCAMFQQCQQGRLAEVREHISQLALKNAAGRAKVSPMKTPTEEEEGDEDESMECDDDRAGISAKPCQQPSPPATTTQEDDDGWTVVRRRK